MNKHENENIVDVYEVVRGDDEALNIFFVSLVSS